MPNLTIIHKELHESMTESAGFYHINYKDGRKSSLPKDAFINWQGVTPDYGNIHIGIQSGLGFGSKIKFDNNIQKIVLGNYFACGSECRFVLNGMHNTNTPSLAVLGTIPGFESQPVEILGDTILGNDIWFGDQVFVMGGVTIGNGCVVGARTVIPPRKKLEPYGVYVGNSAKLIKHRFPVSIIERLEKLKWYDKPLSWLNSHKDFMHTDLNEDIGKSIEMLDELLKEDS
ncbi:hypothetical protein [Pseudoalteromonas sp. G4]|uniref:hypothetical protein n=1 Tax=Pseudoalteromonas sp. G4 TaxID=2992761 RepID=UPI00237D7317|nr:hypothetical protein [Pseudoalteromonas sp. G4]MDE3271249.1 hypothetical protein [Pseudoalteromonas sp. G4]